MFNCPHKRAKTFKNTFSISVHFPKKHTMFLGEFRSVTTGEKFISEIELFCALSGFSFCSHYQERFYCKRRNLNFRAV